MLYWRMSFRRLDHYPRRPHLEFFRRYPDPFYAVTFELDATTLRRALVAAEASTFAGFCWALHRAMLAVEAFRVRLHGEDVVLYDGLRMGLTMPGPERTFSFTQLDWDADPAEFLRMAAAAAARGRREVNLSGGEAPNFAYYTAAPRLPFTSLSHARLPDPTAGQPLIAFGRFREDGGRVLVPVSVQVNHMYVDGADMGDLYEAASEAFARGL